MTTAARSTSTATEGECRREHCGRPAIGRGLCLEHYGRWQTERDPLVLPGDTAPAPERTIWIPAQRAR